MAGPLDIQRPARGLLDALGMKGSGETPIALNRELQLNFDASQLYLYDARRQIEGAGPAPVAGSFQSATSVPAGEFWIMANITWAWVSDAVGATRLRPGYVRPGGGYHLLETEQVISAGAALTYTWARDFDYGSLILQPGWAIGFFTTSYTATVSTSWRVDYYRVTI